MYSMNKSGNMEPPQELHPEDELRKFLEEFTIGVIKLKEENNYAESQNAALKEELKEIEKKLLFMKDTLQDNTQIFYELYEDSKNGLAMVDNALSFLHRADPFHQKENSKLDLSPVAFSKELFVNIEKLPSHVVEHHISRRNSENNGLCNNSNSTSLNYELYPTLAATPLKIDTLKKLELMPTSEVKNISGNNIIAMSTPNINVDSSESHNNANFITKRRQRSKSVKSDIKEEIVNTESEHKRPKRRARPQRLQEESLKRKMRRN